jgi:ABC-2 type transport system permease protein
MSAALATYSLWHRELLRFVRQPSRLAGAFAMPLIFWLLIGTGLSSSFRLPGGPASVSYLEYFFPGTVVLLVLFGAIFSTFSVIDDRNAGFLQGVLVAPVSRSAIVLGKVLGGATLAWLQGVLVLMLAPLAGVTLSLETVLAAAGVLALLSIAMTSLGFAFAWMIDSTQGYHAIMNVVLLPMWFLSGAFFPVAGAPTWLEWIMRLNPLSYGTTAFRQVLYLGSDPMGEVLPSLTVCLVVLVTWCLICFGIDLWVVRRGIKV